MFHSHDGWFFKRDNTDVVILRGSDFSDAEEVVRFTAETWASIVASVSEYGETAESWRQVLRFHSQTISDRFLDKGSVEHINRIVDHLS